MKKVSLAFVLSLCVFFTALAQNPFSIKGIVADTANNSKLHNASIAILNAKDSTLYKFTRAAVNGSFAISPMKKGEFILLLTYPEYADFVANFTLDSTKSTFDFKQINMTSKAKILNEVIIKGRAAAIKIKGDTTEFNAGSYTIQPNDKVEDLLKKLPGIQVDAQGKITAQGKTVPKVLVDGEEFFGDDPTLVTKNLRADMVDKVQLYEKSSDQAAFTGVDDGEKTQTINIKLKEDKKNGYFGKLDVGVATDGFYAGQVLYNRFKGKQKFSAYGTAGNNGKTGLSWQDSDKYGANGGGVEVVDGGILIGGGGDDLNSWGGNYYGEGIPISRSGGMHYETKWNSDKESINTNYKINSLRIDLTKNTLTQQNIPNNYVNRNADQFTDNYVFRQKLDATYQIKLDTTSNLKVVVDGTLKNNDTDNRFKTVGTRADNSLLNTEERSITNKGDEQIFSTSALYTKKLKKLGRNFSLSLTANVTETTNDGYLYSDNKSFETNGTINSAKLTDQFKSNDIKTTALASNFTFTEPISKKISVVLNYGLSLNNGKANRKSFNQSTPGNYDVLDLEFSNNFTTDQLANQGGAIFSYKGKKAIINGGLKANQVNFDQVDIYNNKSYNRSFFNWMPQARYQYKFSQYQSLSIGYNGRTNQPTLAQLQPIKVNDDVLNIPIGNPNLKPSYNNNLYVNYNTYKVISDQYIYAYASVNFINNQIVNNTVFDNTTGKSQYQFINLNGKTPYNLYGYISGSRKIKPLDINIGIDIDMQTNTSYNYINTVLAETNSSSASAELSLSKYKEKKFSFNLSFGPNYVKQQNSLNQAVNNNGLGTSGRGSFSVYLPGKVQISSNANYIYTPSTGSFEQSFERTIVNAELSKTFLKADNLKLSILGNDLLNQNKGFSRSANSGLITQTTYNNITRYFMCSIVWDFNKMGGGVTK